MSIKAGVKAFLTFWPSDKPAILMLMSSMFILFVVPYVYENYIYEPKVYDFSEFSAEVKEAMARIDEQERLYAQRKTEEEESEFLVEGYHKIEQTPKKRQLKLRTFNPNTFTKADARAIGFSEFVIGNIERFRGKGYTYKTKESFLTTYGLEEGDQKKLYAFVDLPTDAEYQLAKNERQAKYEKRKREAADKIANEKEFAVVEKKKAVKEYVKLNIDINTANEEELQKIRGIGEVYAVEIVEFREKIGAFTSIEQIKDVPMMRDSIFQVVKSQFTLSEKPISKLNINEADVATLKAHPYISYKIAKSVVALRKQHGSYTDLNQLKKSKVISAEAFVKMQPFISLE